MFSKRTVKNEYVNYVKKICNLIIEMKPYVFSAGFRKRLPSKKKPIEVGDTIKVFTIVSQPEHLRGEIELLFRESEFYVVKYHKGY